MSGGAYNYVSGRITDAAREVRILTSDEYGTPRYRRLRLALVKHLEAVANVMHALEWADSGDTNHEDAEVELAAFFDSHVGSADIVADAEAWRRLVAELREGSVEGMT